jgi:hypothetical protein
MPHTARNLFRLSSVLATLAFGASWLMTGSFADESARLVLAAAFASWVAISSGITCFLFLQLEERPNRRRR